MATYSGLLGVVAECRTCGWSSEARNALANAKRHADAHGHHVVDEPDEPNSVRCNAPLELQGTGDDDPYPEDSSQMSEEKIIAGNAGAARLPQDKECSGAKGGALNAEGLPDV